MKGTPTRTLNIFGLFYSHNLKIYYLFRDPADILQFVLF